MSLSQSENDHSRPVIRSEYVERDPHAPLAMPPPPQNPGHS
jgi:hypothetical protein